MIDSQIFKSKLHILLNFECFLLPRTRIYLVQMVCLVSLSTLFLSFCFPAQPALSVPISCTDLVCHTMACLKYHCEDSGQVSSLL